MRMGRILQINDMSNPAVRFKTEDEPATWSNIAESNQAITIDLQAYAAMLFEDIAEVQANVDLRGKYTAKMGYSLMAMVEGDITSGLTALPDNFSQVVGTLGVDPTDDDLLRAMQYLDDGDVPQEGRFCYGSPGFKTAIMKMDKFTRSNYVGAGAAERAVRKAEIGDIYGARVLVSSLANNNPAAAAQSYAWFCHREGVALIIQRKPVTHTDFVILEDGWGVLTTLIYKMAERVIPPSTLGGGTSDDRFNVAICAA